MPRLVPFTHHKRNAPRGDVSLDLNVAWGLYDRQARFANSDAYFNLFLAGVGAGKTHAAICLAIVRALKNPGMDGAVFGRTMKDHARTLMPNFFRRMSDLKDQCGVSLIADYDKGEACVTLVNGAKIWFLPFNQVDKLRGLTLSWAVVDEVEFGQADPEDVWTVLTGRMRGHGPVPGLAFATSPNGYRGITRKFIDAQRKYLDAKKRGDIVAMREWGKYHTVTATSFNNPHNPESYFASLRSMSTKRYKQEVEGRVLQPTNTVFQLQAEHFVNWNWRENPELLRVYGVDWGNGATGNAGVMFQVTAGGIWVAADELIIDDCPRGQFMDKLVKWIRSHGKNDPAYIGVDRAIPVENNILRGHFRNTRVRWLEGKEEQAITRGVEMMRDMLEPHEGAPRMVFANSLATLQPEGAPGATVPLVPAMRGLPYFLDSDGNPTTRIRYNTPFSHACDAARYGQQSAAFDAQLHGGRLPWSKAA